MKILPFVLAILLFAACESEPKPKTFFKLGAITPYDTIPFDDFTDTLGRQIQYRSLDGDYFSPLFYKGEEAPETLEVYGFDEE